MLFVLLFCFSLSLFAQKTAYFQQKIAYTIDVKLDDTQHLLTGNIEIKYTNNSPDELATLYFHLWPNAYKNTETEFAKQKYEEGSTKFRLAKVSDRGYIDKVAFSVNEEPISWAYDAEHIDIALLTLNKPIKSGETITIKTPFETKVPLSFSRFGHVETSYQMTQWYPKPAVYDKEGWHAMPYLDQGEFYSEFGTFDVTISLPANYVVGATGVLQTEAEVAFLNEKATETLAKIERGDSMEDNGFPNSATEFKTIRYTAENVHDFAWFADKRFQVLKGEVALASGKKVDTWAMYTHTDAKLWEKAIDYLNRSVRYYSDRIGEYPYPHATAVQSALSAGAGMEYPMITVIGEAGSAKSLDQVITHEVGHNWFYGILGSNERAYTWMDEGFNSFYDAAYTKAFYETDFSVGDAMPGVIRKMLSKDDLDQDLGYTSYLLLERKGDFTPPSTPARQMTSMGYGILGYFYPAYLFRYAEAYLGEPAFDKVMQAYFQKWSFKHPQPQDVKELFEAETGKSFAWLFDDLLGSKKKLDYALDAIKEMENGSVELTVINNNEIIAPFSVSGMKDGNVLETVWYDGFSGTKTITFPKTYQGYRIDGEGVMPEANRYNNYIKSSGGKGNFPSLKLLTGLETGKRKIFALPLIAGNAHDGLLLGAVFYNALIPQKKLEYTIMPLYGFQSKSLAGIADFDVSLFPKSKKIKHMKAGVQLKSFGKFDNETENYVERYLKIMPHGELKFQPSPTSTKSTLLTARAMWIQEEAADFTGGQFSGLNSESRIGYELAYLFKNKQKLNPYSLKASLLGNEYNNGGTSDMRLIIEGAYLLSYAKIPKKGLTLECFAGQFLKNDNKDFGRFPMTLTEQGSSDYYYDGLFLGRGEQDGLTAQQFFEGQGGFKTPLAGFGTGKSNSTMFTVNVKLDVPLKRLPFYAFFDYGYFEDTRPTVNAFNSLYAAGIGASLFQGLLSINYPFWGADELMNAYNSQGGFARRLSFTLHLEALNPKKIIQSNF